MDREYLQEVINGMRKIVKPYLAKQLKKINFDGCGNTDKAEFETDFEIVLTLAEQALAIPSAEPKTGHWIGIDEEPHEVWECDHCGFVIDGSGCIDPYDYRDTYKFCSNCGTRMVEPQESEE